MNNKQPYETPKLTRIAPPRVTLPEIESERESKSEPNFDLDYFYALGHVLAYLCLLAFAIAFGASFLNGYY